MGKTRVCSLRRSDLVAAEAKYHTDCYLLFSSNLALENSCVRSGRPTDADKQEAFKKLCAFLETSEDCQFTLSKLYDVLKEKCAEIACEP